MEEDAVVAGGGETHRGDGAGAAVAEPIEIREGTAAEAAGTVQFDPANPQARRPEQEAGVEEGGVVHAPAKGEALVGAHHERARGGDAAA